MSEHQPKPHTFTNITVVPGFKEITDLEAVLRRAGIAAIISAAEADDGTFRGRIVSDVYGEPLSWTNDGWQPISQGEIAAVLGREFGDNVSINALSFDATGHPLDDSPLSANTFPDYDAIAWLTTGDVDIITVGAASADQDLLVIPSTSDYYRSLVVAIDSPFGAANSSAWLMESSLMMWRHGKRRGFIINTPEGVVGDEWDDSWLVVDPSSGDADVLAAITSIRRSSPTADYAQAFILDEAETAQLEALLAEPPADDTLRRLTEIVGEPSVIADVVEGRVDALDLSEASFVSPRQSFISQLSSFAKRLGRDRRFE